MQQRVPQPIGSICPSPGGSGHSVPPSGSPGHLYPACRHPDSSGLCDLLSAGRADRRTARSDMADPIRPKRSSRRPLARPSASVAAWRHSPSSPFQEARVPARPSSSHPIVLGALIMFVTGTVLAHPRVAAGENRPSSPSCDGSWTVAAHPQVSANDFLQSVSGSSAADVWAVGTYQGPNGYDRTLTLHWDGTRWTKAARGRRASSNTTAEPTWLTGAVASERSLLAPGRRLELRTLGLTVPCSAD